MLTMTTGVPGAGKTLYTLVYVEAMRQKTGRAVFQNGIKDLTLPWEVLEDPTKWAGVPDGSIVVIDEAQRAFRPRGTGAKTPDYVEALETHRHRGIDLFVITQHPGLIDGNIRKLVGQHFHVVRSWGMGRATVNEWPSAKEISRGSMTEAVKHKFAYPKEAFGWYKSAEIHTHKARVPMKVVFLWLSPVIFAVAAYFGVTKILGFGQKTGPAGIEKSAAGASGSAALGKESASTGVRTVSRTEYLQATMPRVAGLLHTAPMYDEVTKVTRAPVPAGCVKSSRGCSCFTQDATPYPASPEMCESFVLHGYFLAFDPAGKQSAQPVQQKKDAAVASTEKSAKDAPEIKAEVGNPRFERFSFRPQGASVPMDAPAFKGK